MPGTTGLSSASLCLAYLAVDKDLRISCPFHHLSIHSDQRTTFEAASLLVELVSLRTNRARLVFSGTNTAAAGISRAQSLMFTLHVTFSPGPSAYFIQLLSAFGLALLFYPKSHPLPASRTLLCSGKKHHFLPNKEQTPTENDWPLRQRRFPSLSRAKTPEDYPLRTNDVKAAFWLTTTLSKDANPPILAPPTSPVPPRHYRPASRPASRTTSASTSTFADISATGITASGITTTGTGPAAAAAPTTSSSQHAESCTASAAHFCTSAAAEPASSHPPFEYSYTTPFSTSTTAATTAAAATIAAAATSLTGTDNNHHFYDHQCDAASPKHTR
ncbi:hypothetical protein Cob_v008292 [Colletotrichum orbiculare MAFF 240422]|uniref:Uncharacterized protein n=1 Tax=Colletotrichum orbiculare (strain 104-T / ATCC 96160 / CBS 514.97 / LARS 414 / MAFF 240422) TaxID=1213857 RepID=A0A484FM72_COLOR|nr:hypothetical protein Cob_v008292 [Colletotrichum orbiculare MAFF 240422]